MKKRFLALALGTLAFGVTLGGVKMGLGHQDAMMVKAAEDETLLTSLTFSTETNSEAIGGYTNSWTAKASDETVFNIKNFNNNNNGWKYVKCGSKKFESVASISTSSAIGKAVTKVQITIDAITVANVNSIKLYVSPDATFNSSTIVKEFTIAKGDQFVSLGADAAEKKFYKSHYLHMTDE